MGPPPGAGPGGKGGPRRDVAGEDSIETRWAVARAAGADRATPGRLSPCRASPWATAASTRSRRRAEQPWASTMVRHVLGDHPGQLIEDCAELAPGTPQGDGHAGVPTGRQVLVQRDGADQRHPESVGQAFPTAGAESRRWSRARR